MEKKKIKYIFLTFNFDFYFPPNSYLHTLERLGWKVSFFYRYRCFLYEGLEDLHVHMVSRKRCTGRREEKVRAVVWVSPNNQSVIIVSLPVLAWAATCCWYWRENKTNYNVRWIVQTLPEKNNNRLFYILEFWNSH